MGRSEGRKEYKGVRGGGGGGGGRGGGGGIVPIEDEKKPLIFILANYTKQRKFVCLSLYVCLFFCLCKGDRQKT